MTHLERAVRDGNARIEASNNAERITYVALDRSERLTNPEERVRAEFWAELIYEYGYSPHRIGIEVTIPDRLPTDRADLVIFHDDQRTRPFAVIECKRDGISDAEFNQAIEQVVGNGTWSKFRADYVMVVAGSTRRALDFTGKYGVLERETNIIADLPQRYGRPEEFKYVKAGSFDLKPVGRQELIATLKKCHQSLWGGGRLSPPAAFGELAKLLFVKISDEVAPRRKGEPYQFQIKTHEPTHKLAARVREQYEVQRRRDPEVFTEDIRVPDDVIRNIVSHLEYISLAATDLDIKGVAFERFMDNFFKGDFGQYFTPREIIEFAVGMLDPRHDDRIIDPACGSAGFLLHALNHVRRQADAFWDRDSVEHFKYWNTFANKNLFGIEINEEIARISKMNMILHGDGHTNILGGDALDRLDLLRERNRGVRSGSFDLVLTNPPFGAQVTLAEHPYLAEYELATPRAGRNSKVRRSQRTEVLFIERIWHLLKPGTGRAAIILPDGLLTNASLQYVRDYIVERFQILAVVSLPQTAFMHFGTGVKASVVFLRRRRSDERSLPDEMVFMASPESVGYDAVGRKDENRLPQVIEDYRRFTDDPQRFVS